jgi:hypothetical protein
VTINRDRFSLALERLKPSDWEHFESLASTFLAAEFGSLRTLAAPSGDGGRDAILFCPDGEPETVFQYSVTENWNAEYKAANTAGLTLSNAFFHFSAGGSAETVRTFRKTRNMPR